MKRRALFVFVSVLLSLAWAFAGRVSLASDPDTERAAARDEWKGELIRAAKNGDAPRVAAALDKVPAMVEKGTFPGLGDAADFIAALPEIVSGLTVVEVRVGWMYVSVARGQDALEPLTKALQSAPEDALARAYFAEAKRQTGDMRGSAKEFALAIRGAVKTEVVMPSILKLAYDAINSTKAPEGDGLPEYAQVVETLLAAKDMNEIRRPLVTRLAYDAEQAKDAPKRAAAEYAAAVRHAAAWLKRSDPGADAARFALEAAGWAGKVGSPRPADVPERFDLLALAVRMGEVGDPEKHEVPEALAAMAEVALAKGRYVLAEKMARRRLAISDSPAARRVLLALPPDVGD